MWFVSLFIISKSIIPHFSSTKNMKLEKGIEVKTKEEKMSKQNIGEKKAGKSSLFRSKR